MSRNLTNLTATPARDVKTAAAQGKPAPPDALGSIVKMRNHLAHPNEKVLARWTHYDWAEAGIYTMHLFELARLWWLGYEGVYNQRTDRSKTLSVPWRKAPRSP